MWKKADRQLTKQDEWNDKEFSYETGKERMERLQREISHLYNDLDEEIKNIEGKDN